jgi:hypothetical protein
LPVDRNRSKLAMSHSDASHKSAHGKAGGSAYLRLAGMLILSFIAMYILMYAMVDKFADVYPNNNQAYMAALMAAPMAIIELLLMGAMYGNRAANLAIAVGGVAVLAVSWVLIRNQTGIDDRQFLRSMIPHHSGAILMCREADLQDAEIRQLCGTIMSGQQAEIDQMRAILARLEL